MSALHLSYHLRLHNPRNFVPSIGTTPLQYHICLRRHFCGRTISFLSIRAMPLQFGPFNEASERQRCISVPSMRDATNSFIKIFSALILLLGQIGRMWNGSHCGPRLMSSLLSNTLKRSCSRTLVRVCFSTPTRQGY